MADCPRTDGVHTAVRASEEWRNTGNVVEVFQAFKVCFSVDRLNRNKLRSNPFLTFCNRSVLNVESVRFDIYVLKFGLISVLLLF